MTDLRKRFVEDGMSLLSQVRQLMKGGPDPELMTHVLTRHTHSLKTMALQVEAWRIGDLIHDLEGLVASRNGGDMDRQILATVDALEKELPVFLEVELSGLRSASESKGPIPAPSSAKEPPADPQGFAFEHMANLSTHIRRRISLLVSRGYACLGLVYQGVELDYDARSLRFQQITSGLERNYAVQEKFEQGDFLSVVLMVPPVPAGTSDEDDPALRPTLPERTPLCRLILKQSYGLHRLMEIWVRADLGLPALEDTIAVAEPVHHGLVQFAALEAKRLDKLVQVQAFGASPYRGHIADTLRGVLQQAVRNSIAHGIETVETRHQAGKSDVGTLVLSAYRDDQSLHYSVEDDGRGYSDEAESTSSDSLSGRGIGLSSMTWQTECLLRGSLDIQSTDGRGTRVHIRIPAELEPVRGLSAGYRDLEFFVPLLYLRAIVSPLGSASPSRIGGQWYCNYLFQNIQLGHAKEVEKDLSFQVLDQYSSNLAEYTLVVVELEGSLRGLLVDRIGGSEIVAKCLQSNTVYSQAFGRELPIFPAD